MISDTTDGQLCPLMKKRCCIRNCMFFDRFCRLREAIEDIHLIAGIIIEKNIDVTSPCLGGGNDD